MCACLSRATTRVADPVQPPQTRPRHGQRQPFAPRRGKSVFFPKLHHFRAIAIRKDQPMTFWQYIARKIGVDRPEKLVAPWQILLPFLVASEICQAGFAFDNPDFAFWAKCYQINPKAILQDEFAKSCKSAVIECTRYTARQEHSGCQMVKISPIHKH